MIFFPVLRKFDMRHNGAFDPLTRNVWPMLYTELLFFDALGWNPITLCSPQSLYLSLLFFIWFRICEWKGKVKLTWYILYVLPINYMSAGEFIRIFVFFLVYLFCGWMETFQIHYFRRSRTKRSVWYKMRWWVVAYFICSQARTQRAVHCIIFLNFPKIPGQFHCW